MQKIGRATLEAIVNSIPSGLIVLEKENGKIVYANDRAVELCGVDPCGLEMPDYSTKLKLLTLDCEVYPPEQLPTSKAIIDAEKAKDDLIIERADGSRIVVSAFAEPIRDEKGEVIAAVGIFEDITEHIKAEEAIKRQAALINLSPDAIIVRTLEGAITFWSKGAEKLYGWTKAEAVGQTSHNLLKTRFPEPLSTIDSQLRIAGRLSRELYHKTKDGREVAVQSRWLAEKDSQGKIKSVLESNIDITKRKKTEDVLRQSEERFSKVFQFNPAAMTITRLTDRVWVDVNESFLRLTEYSREEVIGHNSTELNMFEDPIERAKIINIVRTTQGSVSNYEIGARTKTGKRLILLLSAISINLNGQDHAISMFIDVTRRKQAENKTLRQNAVLNGINKIFQEVLSVGSEEALGEICLSVAEEITQSKLGFIGELNPKGLEDIALSNPAWDACKLIDARGHRRSPGNFSLHGIYGRVLKDGKALFTNDPASHPDSIGLPEGHPPLKAFLGVPLKSEGKTVGMIAVGNREDGYTNEQLESLEALAPAIVEAFMRKRAERLREYSKDLEAIVEERTKKLKDSERLAAIGATAGMVGHDIRNPLQAIISDVYLAETDLASLPDNEKKNSAIESLQEIGKNVEYINKIVADLQDYARPIKPLIREINIEEVIEDILLKNAMAEKNINVSFHAEEGTKKIMSDPDLLKRILGNLVNNAVQAMPEGGELRICVFGEADGYVITVKDTGGGIPEEVKDKIFTPLFTTKSKGQGFGLAAVKHIVEALGGTVTFESEVGKGTTFIIRISAPTH